VTKEVFHLIVPLPIWGRTGAGRAIEGWYTVTDGVVTLCDRDGVDHFDTDLKPRARRIRDGETARFVAHRLVRAMSLERPVGGDFNRRLDYSGLNFKY
jgi:hypothetical protein